MPGDSSLSLYCTINPEHVIPEDRAKRKGLASATCSDECFAELRKRRYAGKKYRTNAEGRALLLRLKRLRITVEDLPLFVLWRAERRKSRPEANGVLQEAANLVRHADTGA